MKYYAIKKCKWLVLALMISCFLPTEAQIKINEGTTIDIPSGTYMITGTSLTVNTGGDLDLRGMATINGSLTNNAGASGFTVESDATGTGSLIMSGSASSNITFQRYADVYAKGQKWHYVSAPVSEQALTTDWMSTNDIGFTDPAWQFFRFSEINNYWIYFDYEGVAPEPFGDETFVDASGYCLTRTSDGVLSFSGTPITENVSYAATYTVDEGSGFNLVGNPFTSFLNATSDAHANNNFITANEALLDDSYKALYIWDEAADYEYGSQDYRVINNAVVTGNAIDQDYIAPGQAFMVKVVSPGGNLAFNTNMQAHNTAAAYKSKEVWPSVELTITGNGNSNSTAIGFNTGMTDGLDPSYDAAKFKGNPNLALYTKLVDDKGKDFAIQVLPEQNSEDLPFRLAIPSLRSGLQTRDAGSDRGSQPSTNNRDFAIQALPDQDIENYIIPIGVDVAESGVFEFSALQENLDNYSLFLEDRHENTFIDLRWDTYFATISESGTGRFYLHFKDATAIGEIIPETNVSFSVLAGQIIIQNPDKEKGTISLVNVSGQVLGMYEMNGNSRQEFSINQATGIYIINIQTEKAAISRKVFLR